MKLYKYPLQAIGCMIIAGSALAIPLSRFRPSPVQCNTGCQGAGTSDSKNCPSGGGTVSIAIQVGDGSCKLVFQPGDPPVSSRSQFSGCSRTVNRTWSGLPANTPMQFCRTYENGVEWCIGPDPSTGPSGGGSNSTTNGMNCNKSDTSSITHSCGASATATATCSTCPG